MLSHPRSRGGAAIAVTLVGLVFTPAASSLPRSALTVPVQSGRVVLHGGASGSRSGKPEIHGPAAGSPRFPDPKPKPPPAWDPRPGPPHSGAPLPVRPTGKPKLLPPTGKKLLPPTGKKLLPPIGVPEPRRPVTHDPQGPRSTRDPKTPPGTVDPEPTTRPTSDPPVTPPTKVEEPHKHRERHGWPLFPISHIPVGVPIIPVVRVGTPPPTTTTTTPTPTPTPTPVTTPVAKPTPTPPTRAEPGGIASTGSGSQPSSAHSRNGPSARALGSIGGLGVRLGPGVFLTGGAASPGPTTANQPHVKSASAPGDAKLAVTGLHHELSSVSGLILGLPLPVPDWSKPIILGLLLICLLLAVRAWRTALRARRLESKGKELAADLESMQAALVPAIPSRLGALDVSVAYRPADGPAAGGDFYDVFDLEGGRVAMIVGDVSGHGRNALARAAHMRYSLRAYAETGLDPRGALKLAGRVLDTEGDDLFTTVAIAVYDPSTARLTYASAGHPAPVFVGPGACEPMTGCASPPIGWGIATGRRQTTVPFPEGARACLFSDGVTEARVDGGLLGRAGLTELVDGARTDSSATELLERVRHEAGSIHDDMAACLIHASAGVAISTDVVEELEADLGHLAAGQGERFLEACGVPPAAADETLARARDIVASQGSVILRVEHDGQLATATASAANAEVPDTPARVQAAPVAVLS
jgi:hypothetical protein